MPPTPPKGEPFENLDPLRRQRMARQDFGRVVPQPPSHLRAADVVPCPFPGHCAASRISAVVTGRFRR